MINHGTPSCETVAIFNIPTASTLDSWKKQFETKEFDGFNQRNRGVHP